VVRFGLIRPDMVGLGLFRSDPVGRGKANTCIAKSS